MAGPEVEFRLLGPFQVWVGGEQVAVSSGRQRTLLAALALSAGRSVPVDALAHAVWGENLPERVRGSLQTNVMRLRRALGEDSITRTADGYRLDVASERVDVSRFLRLSGAPQDADERNRLADAIALWRGEPLSGVSSSTLREQHVPQLVERYLLAVERRTDLDLAAGSVDGRVIGELRDLLARQPLRESLWERLIRALACVGRAAEALAAYAECHQRLADELGVDPGANLRRLHAELLAADEPATAVSRPRQLPREIGRFTGRARELAALTDFLTGHRFDVTGIVVVEGCAGMGKTSLVVRWAHRVRDVFPDGQLFVDLRGHAEGNPVSPSEALHALLTALGVPADAVPYATAQRSALLRSTLAGRHALLVLDNARDADQIRPLLPGPGSVVVVTSRNQLRGLVAREGAVRITLREFDEAEATGLLARGLGRSRVDAEPAAAVALTDLCGRLPLAVALVAERASRFPDLPLRELVDDLRDQRTRMEMLRDPYDAGADLAATFSWSYHALQPAAARMFRLLGLHPGGDFGPASVAALCGAGLRETRELLDQLVAAHLLNQPRPDRFQFHDLLRVYARNRVAQEENDERRAAAADRILDWYVCAAGRARYGITPSRRVTPFACLADSDERLPSFTDHSAARAWFQTEHDALVDVVHGAVQRGRHDAVWRLSFLLLEMFRSRNELGTWLETARHGLASAQAVGDHRAVLLAGNTLGIAAGEAGRWDEALSAFQAVLDRWRAVGEDDEMALVLGNIGVTYFRMGDYSSSVTFNEKALAATPPGDRYYRAIDLANLSVSYQRLGRYEEAVTHGRQALALFQPTDNAYHRALTLRGLAEAHEGLGDLDVAVRFAAEAVQAHRTTHTVHDLAEALTIHGRILAALGRSDEAGAAREEAVKLGCAEAGNLLALPRIDPEADALPGMDPRHPQV